MTSERQVWELLTRRFQLGDEALRRAGLKTRPRARAAPGKYQILEVITAIVLLHVDVHAIPETATTLANIDRVSEVYSVTGEWDNVVVLKLERYEDLDDVVTGHLRRVEGIARTQTMLAFRTYNEALLDQGFGVGLDEGQPS